MKKSLHIVAAFLGISLSGISQELTDILPYSSVFDISSIETNLPTYTIADLDINQLAAEDADRGKNGQFLSNGRVIPVNINLNNSGVWSTLPNGDRLWRVRLATENARGLAPYFDNFYLPEGSFLHVYNDDKTMVLGAFTSINNQESKMFATWPVTGNAIILEYYEPASVYGSGIINLNEVSYIYRFEDQIEDREENVPGLRNGSQSCEVDVACSESNGWSDQIRGVSRIFVRVGSFTGWCTGSLVNNTFNDCRPYYLTALHCGYDNGLATTSNFNQWVFRFNYQKSGCGTGSKPAGNQITGCTWRAHSNDGGGNSGSDFLLVEFNNSTINSAFNVYFNGWDRVNSTSNSGVGIHHPSGDVKKISTYSANLVNSTWGGPAGTHWRVSWVATANGHGVTEGGSSGSPIFRGSNKLIMGTLTGGSSFCTSPTAPDYYGKFSYHWESNPGASTNNAYKLRPWLDPAGTNPNTLNGKNNVSCSVGINEIPVSNLFSVYPNPSNGIVNLTIAEQNFTALQLRLYNAVGQLINTYSIAPGIKNYSVDLSELPMGAYHLSVSNGKEISSKTVIISR
jgi:hypothetical protein